MRSSFISLKILIFIDNNVILSTDLTHRNVFMKVTQEQLSETQVKMNITVPVEDMQKFLERAAKKISLKAKIKGFRPGKASYDVIKQQFGEMAIYQEAVNSIIDNTFLDAMKSEGVDYVGMPNIDVVKMAPGNPLEYTATFDLMPTVTLPKKWKDIKIDVKKEEISDDKVQEVLDNLGMRHAQQILKEDAAASGDKMVLDFELSFDNVVPENGTAQNFEVLIGDNKMIPGFEDQLVGLKAEEKKEFDIEFPKDYFNKEFGGKTGTFKITVKHVFTIEQPEFNDEFAKNFGLDSFDKMKEEIMGQLKNEAMQKAEHEAELEMFDTLAEKSEYSTIPESMVDAEKETMVREMQQNIARQGLNFDDYLTHMGKTVDQLKEDMAEDALKRVKSGLIVKTVREEEDINVTDEEVQAEVDKAIAATQGDEKMQEQFKSTHYKMYIKNTLAIKKVTQFMKNAMMELPECAPDCSDDCHK